LVKALGGKVMTMPITQAEAAHTILQRRENIGKVVLTLKTS